MRGPVDSAGQVIDAHRVDLIVDYIVQFCHETCKLNVAQPTLEHGVLSTLSVTFADGGHMNEPVRTFGSLGVDVVGNHEIRHGAVVA